MKKLLTLLLALALIFSFAACKPAEPAATGSNSPAPGNSPVPGNTPAPPAKPVEISVAFTAMPNGLDPISEDTNTTLSVCYHIYDKIVDLSMDYEMVPSVAKSWKQIDGVTWEFEINLDYTFQNGDKLTMDDVVYSVQRLKSIPKTADTGNLVASVTYSGNVLTIKTVEENNTIIPRVLGITPVVNKAYIEAGGDDAVYKKPIGTGPYKVTEFIPGTTVVVETWDGYPFEKPQIDKITFSAIPENASRYIAVETGQLQYAGLVSAMENNLAVKNDKLGVLADVSNRAACYVFNCERAPFDNVNVRRALTYALDRTSICALQGGRPALESMLFGGFDLYTDPTNLPGYDLAKAKELLADEGYNESNPLSFSLTYFSTDAGIELYQSTLKSIGVNMSLNLVEFSVFLTKEGPGDYDVIWTTQPNRGNVLLDLDRFDDAFLGARDISRYHNPQFNDIAHKMRTTTNAAELKTLAVEANKIISEDVPMLAVYRSPIFSVMAKGLTGVTVRADLLQSFRHATYIA